MSNMLYLKTSLFFGLLLLLIVACSTPQQKSSETKTVETDTLRTVTAQRENPLTGTMTDPRDGEVYKTVVIGNKTWMAENLRYYAYGSMINPDNPSKSYGRLYELFASQASCPEGWHLPTEKEWDDLEILHGMPDTFRGVGGWRGEHAVHLKSTSGWDRDGNGTDSLGFNALPAGYYFSGNMGGEQGMQGLHYSAAFWSYMGPFKAAARFMFSSRTFVNKWEDEGKYTGSALSCRCVKDE